MTKLLIQCDGAPASISQLSLQTPSSLQLASGWRFSSPEQPVHFFQRCRNLDVSIPWVPGEETRPQGLGRHCMQSCVKPTSVHLIAAEQPSLQPSSVHEKERTRPTMPQIVSRLAMTLSVAHIGLGKRRRPHHLGFMGKGHDRR